MILKCEVIREYGLARVYPRFPEPVATAVRNLTDKLTIDAQDKLNLAVLGIDVEFYTDDPFRDPFKDPIKGGD